MNKSSCVLHPVCPWTAVNVRQSRCPSRLVANMRFQCLAGIQLLHSAATTFCSSYVHTKFLCAIDLTSKLAVGLLQVHLPQLPLVYNCSCSLWLWMSVGGGSCRVPFGFCGACNNLLLLYVAGTLCNQNLASLHDAVTSVTKAMGLSLWTGHSASIL